MNKITFATHASNQTLLAALHAHIDAGNEPLFRISTATRGAADGSLGTCIEAVNLDADGRRLQIPITDHAQVPAGMMADGGNQVASDFLVIGCGFGITDITLAGFTQTGGFSGYCADATGGTPSSATTAYVDTGTIVDGAGAPLRYWFRIMTKLPTGYLGQAMAGGYNSTVSTYTGYGIRSGKYADIALTSAQDHVRVETVQGNWEQASCQPLATNTMQGAYATDTDHNAVDQDHTYPVAWKVPMGAPAASVQAWAVCGTDPVLYCGGVSTINRKHRDADGDVAGITLVNNHGLVSAWVGEVVPV